MTIASRGARPADHLVGALVERAAEQLMEGLEVQLYHVELGCDLAVGLGNYKHRGAGYLLGLDVGRFGFGTAHVEGTFGDIAYFLVFILYGTDAVHEVAVHYCVILLFFFESFWKNIRQGYSDYNAGRTFKQQDKP